MKLRVTRDIFTDLYTHGKLYIDNKFFCYTLEDRDRYLENPVNRKVDGQSAIPVGTYAVIVDMSKRFGRLMPHVLEVPGFEGIRIHSGNTAEDTEGCLLVGNVRGRDRVMDSRAAFMALMQKLDEAYDNKEDITITYEREEM